MPDDFPIIRPARFTDHAGIAALEASQGLKSKPFEEWRQLWSSNPCYQELGQDFPIGWVLETKDGQIVGSLGNLPLPYVFQGQKILVTTGRGWSVDEKYRSFALMLMDEYFNQPNVDVFLNTTVNAEAVEAFGVFGSLRVPAGDWGTAAFFVSRARAFAETALRIRDFPQARLLSYPAGFALSIHDALRSKRIGRPEVEVRISFDFDEKFDGFWGQLCRTSQSLLAVRSRKVLQWHFAAAIARKQIWVLTIEQGTELQAYAVLQRRDEPQYGLTRMRLVDFQALESPQEYCRAVISTALTACAKQGIQVLEQVGCKLGKTNSFDAFAPHRRSLPSWSSFYTAKNAALAERLANPLAWEPSSYDGDASL